MDKPELSSEIPDQPVEAAPARASRPASVTFLVIGVLIITVINLVRLVLGIREWDFLASLPGISPLYITLTGLIWTLTGLTLLWGLWRAKDWAPRLMQALALTYALYYWLDHVFLVDHPLGEASGAARALLPVNWPFAAGVTVICLAYTAWVMNRRKVKAYFSQQETSADPEQAKDDTDGSFRV